MKSTFHLINSRAGKTLLLVLLEVLWILVLSYYLHPYAAWLESSLRIISVFIVLYIVNTSKHLSSDLMWVMIVMIFPVAGALVYIFFEVADRFSSPTYKNIQAETKTAAHYYVQDEDILKEAKGSNPLAAGQFEYLSHTAGFPVYRNTQFSYYGVGEEGWPVMLEEMRKAKHFIFLEYFIIEKGRMWNSMLEILKQKAAQGVDCRVLYDDMGSINTVPIKYACELEKMGIKAQAFNKVNPLINGIMNHRDHRKILVIDGKTAFSGGINLADEYINIKSKYGHWKDNCIRIKGPSVWSYTVLFLTMWNAARHEDDDYTKYKAKPYRSEQDGWIVPYGDTPLDDSLIGENVYINILNAAQKYCYIFTPYLIIDEDMMNALILAAQRGVDVRIITPGIPDKKIIYNITRSYYPNLIKAGVKIYEYTPGFDHAKVFVSDDTVATVGTINLDYRSLYLHFENGTLLCNSKEIARIRDDFLDSMKKSREVTLANFKPGILRTILYMNIRLFAPMM